MHCDRSSTRLWQQNATLVANCATFTAKLAIGMHALLNHAFMMQLCYIIDSLIPHVCVCVVLWHSPAHSTVTTRHSNLIFDVCILCE